MGYRMDMGMVTSACLVVFPLVALLAGAARGQISARNPSLKERKANHRKTDPICFQNSHLARPPKTLRFSGYEWEIRGVGDGGPGPNHWDPGNVRVDEKGWLHLKITHTQGEWRCAELHTKKRFGFGRYQFQVTGRVDTLDPNTVLGLFKYPTADVGKDGTNEIDIEFARWGHTKSDNLNFTVYPASGERDQATDHKTYPLKLQGEASTHQFEWESKRVRYRSFYGHRDDDGHEITHWTDAPDDLRLIPQRPTPVFLNLWLFRGNAPTDGKEVEIVIRKFTFASFDPID